MKIQSAVREQLVSDNKTAPPSPRPQILFVEGIRGLAALGVLLYHVYNAVYKQTKSAQVSSAQVYFYDHFLSIFALGQFGVQVFIVISGFCLMLPLAVSPNGTLSGGALGFFKRRARRILPPYYTALVISLLLYKVLAIGKAHLKVLAHVNAPHITVGQLLSHVFLIENWSPAWKFTIDGPMWSVALECQIYLLFPLILIPLWKRYGNWAVLAGAFAIGMSPHLFYNSFNTHYVGLFTLGMLAALFAFSKRSTDVSFAERTPWALLASSFFCIFLYRFLFHPHWLTWSPVNDTFEGLMAACFLVWASRSDKRRLNSPFAFLVKVFESKPAVLVGEFSYSIYLVHHPIVIILSQVIRRFNLPPVESFVVVVAVALPICLGAGYLFFLAVERPFLSKTARRRVELERVEVGAVRAEPVRAE